MAQTQLQAITSKVAQCRAHQSKPNQAGAQPPATTPQPEDRLGYLSARSALLLLKTWSLAWSCS
jgi:hypothetical protein